MFTGIVEELGEVVSVDHLADAARIVIRASIVAEGAARGASIAVSGVCLTVADCSDGEFAADVMAETLRRTTVGSLAPGSPVNLERPLRFDGRLGGHLVQGHVDGVAAVISRDGRENWDVVRIAIPAGLERYLVEKGSVAVDGVSLTVSALGADAGAHWFEVSLIPATLATTTLGRSRVGAAVNVEVDVIGKYVERMLAARIPGREAAPAPPLPPAPAPDPALAAVDGTGVPA